MKNGLTERVVILVNNKFSFKQVDNMTGRELFCVERLRCNSFVTEQKITLPELDDTDLVAIQVFLLNKTQTIALATCRLFQNPKYGWMIGRVAVAKEVRGQHLGTAMMKAVHKFLKARGASSLTCHAQLQAKNFYENLGYQVKGATFLEGGIKHVLMSKEL